MTRKNAQPRFEISFEQAVIALKKHELFLTSRCDSEPPTAKGIVADTRKLLPDFIYVAYAGVSQNLHRYIPQALKSSCSFVVCEEKPKDDFDSSYIQVKNGRAAWAVIAAEGWRIDARKLRYIGITGTSGKTSVCHTIADILTACGHRSLSVGTLGARVGREMLPTTHTTPDPDEFYQIIAEAHEEHQVQTVVMEVSSHALAQYKLEPMLFDVCVFTSFSRDHLDFHTSMEEYLNTKLKLFSEYAQENARFVVHQDLISQVEKIPKRDRWSYGVEENPHLENHVLISPMGSTPTGAKVKISGLGEDRVLDIPYINQTGALNFAAALIAADFVAPDFMSHIQWNADTLSPVPGRLEKVSVSGVQDIDVIVDYSHKPDALEKCLHGLRPAIHGHAKLWVVMGCGGDRDKGKRPLMGKIAVEGADEVVVTSDNPRHEDPQAIIDDVCRDLNLPQKNVHVEIDRHQAIEYAILKARPGDTVVIAGKGHETYQIIGTKHYDFDDRLVAAIALRKRT